MITVQLHTILQWQTPEGRVSRLETDIPPGGTLADLLRALEIELAPEHLLLVVNGRVEEAGYPLKEGDQVNLMPALSGG